MARAWLGGPWLPPCSWESVMCAPRYRPASPKQTARTLAAWPTFCAWVGSGQCTSKAWTRAKHRALLTARSTLVRRLKDIENSVRGLLRGFGIKLATTLRAQWDVKVRESIAGHLPAILEPLLVARAALRDQVAIIDKRVRDTARQDQVCRRLMTMPGVGPIVALTYRAAVDEPERFVSSKSVGASFGLTPRRYQSGETDRVGCISRVGDASGRVALFEAAHVMLTRSAKWSSLKSWAIRVAQRRGLKRAKVALARKLAVVLHRMWMDSSDFRFTASAASTAT